MEKEKLLSSSLFTYSRLRTAGFVAQGHILNFLSELITKPTASNRSLGHSLRPDKKTLINVKKELFSFLKQDAQRIASGVYPASVLWPESPVRHAVRIPKVFFDGIRIARRRTRHRTTEFSEQAKAYFEDVPRYYRRNFHFQTNGYLSETSAEIYEHQVEILFAGAADAMRRLILAPMKKQFRTDGKGLMFLELGAGTGRTTKFVSLAFPKAKVISVDLSHPYLKIAHERLKDFSRIDLLQANASHLPFENKHFDAVFSVFLFHELPRSERIQVLKESKRVLKDGGFFGFVDSLQLNDKSQLTSLLQNFPKEFHEPFYRDYIENPMEVILKKAGFKQIKTERGFLSKVCSAKK